MQRVEVINAKSNNLCTFGFLQSYVRASIGSLATQHPLQDSKLARVSQSEVVVDNREKDEVKRSATQHVTLPNSIWCVCNLT